MFRARLNHAQRTGMQVADCQSCVHLFPEDGSDMDAFPADAQEFVHRFFPTVARLTAQGFEGGPTIKGQFDAAVVHVPRSKQLARHLVNWACQLAPDGIIYVDGAKTQGIESLMKAVKAITPLTGVVSAAHGRLFWFHATGQFALWDASSLREIENGFKTQAGIFSAEHIDPGSAFLADALEPLSGHIADLGAGWGYLSHHLLSEHPVSSIDLVEADHAAASCARLNCDDTRAQVFWQGIDSWEAQKSYDHVVMNPPFHEGRKGEPDLGKAFIRKAAGILKKKGKLWMVANRHLPYEETLSQLFVDFRAIAGDKRFKVLLASGPRNTRL
jgi:16S rRNA (guanine1207-N2)-methyltransferase